MYCGEDKESAAFALQESDDRNAVYVPLRNDFFESAKLRSLQFRALTYLDAGVPVHFRGPAGTGKTTLALQIAASIGRPTAIISGDNWLTSSDFIGNSQGTRTKQIVDRYVHSVQRTETESEQVWVDNVLTRAITNGYTLVYDEFTRSSPEANNPLLMALEERMIVLSGKTDGPRYVQAHPDFRAILTSNPDDYAGVSTPQDALIDRMITLDISYHERETEIGIVVKRAHVDTETSSAIVDIVREIRQSNLCGQVPSLRASIMIAKVVRSAKLTASAKDPGFVQLCFDILKSKAPRDGSADGSHETYQRELVSAVKRASVTTAQKAPDTPLDLKEAS